ncbi:MAG: hypothetical protein LBB63_02585 [Holosporaceae bacterium]|jgi:hypothetical protein|nr:hypothetical protein [Holosporaceae bacterium]
MNFLRNLPNLLLGCLLTLLQMNYGLLQVKAEAPVGQPEDELYYPFTKASAQIPKEEVIGICVKKDHVVYFGSQGVSDYVYYMESFTRNNDFSEIDFFKQYPKLASVEINGLKLTRDMLENLQKFLPTTLKNFMVDFCDIKHDDIELLADVIRKHEQLTSVRIKAPGSSPEESDVILSGLKDHLKMTSLSLTFGELSPGGVDHLISIMEGSDETLEGLYLAWGNIVSTSGEKIDKDDVYKKLADAFDRTKKLKSLEFSSLYISEPASAVIFKAIGQLRLLKELKIFFDNLNSHDSIKLFESMEVLRDSLKELPDLESLDISNLRLHGNEVQVLMQAVASTPKLKHLNISGNTLDVKGAEILSDGVKENNSLMTLMANSCTITADVFKSLCKSLANSSLEHLYVSDNEIKDAAKDLPIDTMQDMLVIDFSKNNMNYDDAMAFVEKTKGHMRLRIVNFKNNSGINAMSNTEKTIRDDQLVEWKIKNYVDEHQVQFFGL